MRLLFLMQGRTVEDHPGYHDACQRLLSEGQLSAYEVIPYFGRAAVSGWEGLWDEVVDIVHERQLDLVFFHAFHSPRIAGAAACVRRLRRLPVDPTVCVSAGDPFSWNWMPPRYPRSFRECSQAADITFSTTMGENAARIASWGARNVVLLPLGACQVRFRPHHIDEASYRPTFDVVMIANDVRCRNPASLYFRSSQRRRQLVAMLSQRYGSRFGLFGHGWEGEPSWCGPLPFDAQTTIGSRTRTIVGGFPASTERYYASNRPFIQTQAGVPFVDWGVPGLDRLLRAEDHWFPVVRTEQVVERVDELLDADPSTSLRRAQRTAHYVHATHSQYARMRFVVDTAARYREAQRAARPLPTPRFDYFLPEIDAVQERPEALVGWHGA